MRNKIRSEKFKQVMVLLKENKITKKDLPDYAKYLVLKSKFEVS